MGLLITLFIYFCKDQLKDPILLIFVGSNVRCRTEVTEVVVQKGYCLCYSLLGGKSFYSTNPTLIMSCNRI